MTVALTMSSAGGAKGSFTTLSCLQVIVNLEALHSGHTGLMNEEIVLQRTLVFLSLVITVISFSSLSS